eukprot:scaffold15550_cov448-Alexandrium_tamarense.AAC.1
MKVLYPASSTSFAIDSSSSFSGDRLTYSQLRATYLERGENATQLVASFLSPNTVHAMHPDKVAHRKEGQRTSSHLRFIELKNAWEDFDSIAKQHSSVSNNNKQNQSTEAETLDEEGCFTTFGVGCSFADSEEEKDLRNEFMEQACRGWLSS